MSTVRIAACGIALEASTFSPHRSSAADFDVLRGDAVLGRYAWLDADWAQDASWHGVLHARALPGGPLVAADYVAWRDEITAGLASLAPVDGVLLDIHGALSVVDMEDAEADLAAAIRSVVGMETIIASPMDLHGNVSTEFFGLVDILTCYRTAPHIDVAETRERAARALVAACLRGQRPAKALVHVPILLPGEQTSTRVEPARSLYARIPDLIDAHGIHDLAYWIGFAWADEPRCKAAVVATGESEEACDAAALALADDIWSRRDEFEFVAPVASMSDCLDGALASPTTPFFISDSGDNPGAGGADDVTIALAETLARKEFQTGRRALVVSLVDPDSVAAARRAGAGAEVRTRVGGRIDARAPGPLDITGTVAALAHCPQGGDVARITVGGVDVVVTSRRSQYATLDMYDRLGCDPRDYDVVVVKIGYLEPELFEVQRGWMMALTPGGVDQDLARLGHRRIDRPMHPFDAPVAGVELRVQH